MELRQYIATLWKWWWLLVLATVIAGGVSYWNSSRAPKLYFSSVTLRVGQFLENSNPQAAEFATSQQLAQGYAQTALKQPVLQAAANALGLVGPWESLAAQVTSSAVGGTSLLQVGATDSDPVRAKAIADEIARQLILQSPTTQLERERAQRADFVNQQLASLQTRIDRAEADMKDLESRLEQESSARNIRDLQDQIWNLQQQQDAWRSTYANLVNFSQGRFTNYLAIVEPARVPSAPLSNNGARNAILASLIGLLLAAGAATLMESLDDTLSGVDDATRILGIPTLGVIRHMGRFARLSNAIVALGKPMGPASEAYRVLGINIRFACLDDRPLLLMVTSPGSREGKSVTAANLAVSFAEVGMRVILVDADLRRPSIHSIFDLPNHVGLTSLFLGDTSSATPDSLAKAALSQFPKGGRSILLKRRLQEILITPGMPGLSVLVAGPVLANPSAILGSARMEKLISALGKLADVVIFDSSPTLPVADTTVLAGKGVRVVMVIEARRTRRAAALQAQDTLTRAHARVVGAVVNKAPRGQVAHYDAYYRPAGRTAFTITSRVPVMWNGFVCRVQGALRAVARWIRQSREELAGNALWQRGFPLSRKPRDRWYGPAHLGQFQEDSDSVGGRPGESNPIPPA